MGFTCYYQGEYKKATAFYEEALTLLREIEGGGNEGVGAGFTLSLLGRIALVEGEYDRAVKLGVASTATGKVWGQMHLTAAGLDVTGRAWYFKGEVERARSFLEASMAISQEIGNTQDVADMLNFLGLLHFRQGDSEKAVEEIERALALSETLSHRMGVACAQSALGQIALDAKDTVHGEPLVRASLESFRQMGLGLYMTRGLELMAFLTAVRSEMLRSARLIGAATAARDALGAPLTPYERSEWGRELEKMKRELGRELFRAAVAEGRALIEIENSRVSLVKAVAFALEGEFV
jgi:tetratricopeptide (TPR) repeat protein